MNSLSDLLTTAKKYAQPKPIETTGSDWIQTYTGKKFFPLDPDPDLICIEDIAHSLAMQCRYNGHTKTFYSVAQHSVLLGHHFTDPGIQLAALLHDASEAYLSDIPRPIKHLPEFAFYREAEDSLQRMIIRKFGVELNVAEWKLIKLYDREMIVQEAPQLMAPLHPDWTIFKRTRDEIPLFSWTPEVSETIFLSRFYHLQDKLEHSDA